MVFHCPFCAGGVCSPDRSDRHRYCCRPIAVCLLSDFSLRWIGCSWCNECRGLSHSRCVLALLASCFTVSMVEGYMANLRGVMVGDLDVLPAMRWYWLLARSGLHVCFVVCHCPYWNWSMCPFSVSVTIEMNHCTVAMMVRPATL